MMALRPGVAHGSWSQTLEPVPGAGDPNVKRWTPMAGRYEIRIKGRVTAAMLAAFGDMGLEPEETELVYTGPVTDQAALRGIVERILSTGAEIVAIERLQPERD